MEEKNHIYPIFDRMMTRQDKEELLGQHRVMNWLSWMGIISVVELIITWDSPKRTGWKISVA